MQKLVSMNCAANRGGGSGQQQHQNDNKMLKNNGNNSDNDDDDDDENTDLSNSNSILEFLENLNLNDDDDDFNNGDNSNSTMGAGDDDDNNKLTDIDSIFEKINRLSSSDYNNGSVDRPVDEILREAEYLLEKQMQFTFKSKNSCDNNKDIDNSNSNNKKFVMMMKNDFHHNNHDTNNSINKINEFSISNFQLSQESTPRDMQSKSEQPVKDRNTDDIIDGDNCIKINTITLSKESSKELNDKKNQLNATSKTIQIMKNNNKIENKNLSLSSGNLHNTNTNNDTNNSCSTKVPFNINDNNNRIDILPLTTTTTITNGLPSSSSSPSLSAASSLPSSPSSVNNEQKNFCNKSTITSPIHYIATTTSPIQHHHPVNSPSSSCSPIAIKTKEYSLKCEIERLQEKLKDTEERLQSLRIQHDSLSQIHRDLRDNYQNKQDELELLKLNVKHLNDCIKCLRNELQLAKNDRNEINDIQKQLQNELNINREEKKQLQQKCDKDTKIIQDLQRQCKEMERILIRKHPDSVSALIVTTKNSKLNDDLSSSAGGDHSRKLLEQRIAQLESDAKEQDIKSQKILANVQARFNSVQAKYETHIADLETQVLSLQEINTKLNEKIESQMTTLSNLDNNNKQMCEISSQTDEETVAPAVALTTSSSSTQTDSKFINNALATTNRQIPIAKKSTTNASGITSTGNKMNVSHSDTMIASASSSYHHHSYSHQHHHQTPSTVAANAKEETHLLATIRGMRIDLAIKDKAIQRLTRELDECKKTIKKLQKEKEVMKNEKSSSLLLRGSRDHHQTATDQYALKEALNKIKLLESDYKTLKDKRLQDLKSLQSAHERELASCHETVRILQQRLAECGDNGGDGGGDENFTAAASQKRRKVPIDYYALKAKVSSLERRHSEREQRLHMLVEALSSKGRLNGALEEILNENNQ